MKRIDWQKLVHWPQNFAQRLEAYNPDLARKLLNYASQISQPALLGTHFDLEEWSDHRVGLNLPRSSWDIGQLVTFAEFMVRSLLARHLPGASDGAVRFVAVQAQVQTGRDEVGLKLRLELPEAEREQWFHELLGSGLVQKTIVVRVWSAAEVFRGEIALTIDLRHAPALPSSPTQS